MDVLFRLQDIEFEWNQEKAQINEQKHKIKFEEAAEVFLDLFCVFADASVDQEQRQSVTGLTFDMKILLTVFVERGERVRIISARLATADEQKHYAERR